MKKRIPKDYAAAIIIAAKAHFGPINRWNIDLMSKVRLPYLFNGLSPQDFGKLPVAIWKNILTSKEQ